MFFPRDIYNLFKSYLKDIYAEYINFFFITKQFAEIPISTYLSKMKYRSVFSTRRPHIGHTGNSTLSRGMLFAFLIESNVTRTTCRFDFYS